MTEPRKFTSEEFAACLEELEVEEAHGSAWIVLELRAENEKLRRAHRIWEVGHALVAPRIAENERLRAAWDRWKAKRDELGMLPAWNLVDLLQDAMEAK